MDGDRRRGAGEAERHQPEGVVEEPVLRGAPRLSCVAFGQRLHVRDHSAEAGVKHLVLVHLSGRYLRREIREAIAVAAKRHGRPPKLVYFFESRYYEIAGEAVPSSKAGRGA